MLTFVLPLLALAIALTPLVVAARMTYNREMTEQVCEPTSRSSPVITTAQVH